MSKRRRIVILGAAGRDFHNFNVVYRDDPATEVVAFTAAQIPGIAGAALSRGACRDGVIYADIKALAVRLRAVNSRAPIMRAASLMRLGAPEMVRGRRVTVVEDGPTLTHGGMPHGAGISRQERPALR